MERAHTGYFIAAALGAITMTLVGYFVFAAPDRGISFDRYLAGLPWSWAALGAMMGVAWWRLILLSR